MSEGRGSGLYEPRIKQIILLAGGTTHTVWTFNLREELWSYPAGIWVQISLSKLYVKKSLLKINMHKWLQGPWNSFPGVWAIMEKCWIIYLFKDLGWMTDQSITFGHPWSMSIVYICQITDVSYANNNWLPCWGILIELHAIPIRKISTVHLTAANGSSHSVTTKYWVSDWRDCCWLHEG